MSGHTPGPWTFKPEAGTPGKDDNDMGGIRAVDGSWICDFGNGTHYYPTQGTPPCAPDGLLMAAAPDLLEACRLFVAYDDGDDEDGLQMMLDYAAAIDTARSAIAKATQP